MSDLEKMKLWIDSEMSINHAYYWAILGAIVGGKFWWVAGLGIAISVIYALMRAVRLPKDYLSVKGIPLRPAHTEVKSRENK